MTYMRNLSPVSYHNFDAPIKAVGWLESSHDYTQGTADVAFMAKLWTHIERPIEGLSCLGMHFCSLCHAEGRVGPDCRSSQHFIFIPTSDFLYEAPIWIGHYIQKHSYLPPKEFGDAVSQCAPAGSEELRLQITKLFPRVPNLEHLGYQRTVSFFGHWDIEATLRPSPEYGDLQKFLDNIERERASAPPPPTRDELIEENGGLSTKQCIWARCENKALSDLVVCIDYAYLNMPKT